MIPTKTLKHFAFTFVFVLLAAFGVCGLAQSEAPVNCYWQLDEIVVETTASERTGAASALTDVTPVSGLDIEEMIDALRGAHSFSLDLDRESTGKHAHADFSYTTVPALVPGAAAARLSITANTQVEDNCFYLYSTVNAGGSQVARVRGNGAWVVRTFFPRQAVPGTVRTLGLTAKEYNGLAQARVTYRYVACPGAMIIDTNSDIVL